MINKAFFSITDENVLKYIQNDFILSNYQTYLAPDNAMYIIDNTRVYLSDFMYARAQAHTELDSKLKITRYEQYKILKLSITDLSSLMIWVNNGMLYNGIEDKTTPESVTERIIDARMCENLLELMKNGAAIFYREYDMDIYEESNSEPLKDKLLRYINIDTRVDSSSDNLSLPSNPMMRNMLEMLESEVIELGFTAECTDKGLLITIEPNTSKDIPCIGFTAHIDSHNKFAELPSPYIIKLLDQFYAKTGVNLVDKPYTQAELDSWYKEGVIASSKGGLGINGKAGVVELMGVLEYLKAHPDIPHGELVFYFSTDAELGRSMNSTILPDKLKECKMVFFLESEGLNEISYSSFDTYYMKFVFNTGSSKFDNAIKNTCEFVREIMHGSNANQIGEVTILSLNGDTKYATLELEVKDLESDIVTEKIDAIIRTLNNITTFSPTSVTYINNRLYGNIQAKIPSSMISLASEANYNVFNRAIIGTVLADATNVSKLIALGIPSIVLSNGVYNPYLETECIPIPSLKCCRDVIVEIIKLSYDSSFPDLT